VDESIHTLLKNAKKCISRKKGENKNGSAGSDIETKIGEDVR
jgi:hypothetical protein